MTHPRPTGFVRAPEGLRRRVDTRIVAGGTITFPAVPALLDEYTEKCTKIFSELGRPFSGEEVAHLRSILDRLLIDAFTQSQRSTVTISYQSHVAGALDYTITVNCLTIEDAYHEWVATREPPLFGVEPDARIWALANEAVVPADCPVLDIGAGTGRNALALARRGHPVDAVEMTPKFADTIRKEADGAGLDVRVIQRDVFATDADLRRDYGMIILSEVVPEFRTTAALRQLFELAARCLRLGGRLVFNVFLADSAYNPEHAARQFAQQAYSGFFTRPELADAASGLPLHLVADDCVCDYERDNLPDGAWPPTSWYAGWVSGRDIFGLDREECPVDMRWMVYRKV